MKTFVAALVLCTTACYGLPMPQAVGAPAAKKQGAGADVSKQVVDATMARLPTAAALGAWDYSRALFLLGEMSVYDRVHDPKYLAYAKAWADVHISADGSVDVASNS